MFVHPHPAFGVFADGVFKLVPDLLSDCGDVVFRHGADGAEDLDAIGAVGPGNTDAGDDGKAEPLSKRGVEGGDAGFESEAVDHGGGTTGFHVEVGEKASMTFAFEAFDEAEHGAV